MKNIFLLGILFGVCCLYGAQVENSELFNPPREGTVQAAVLNIRVLPDRKYSTVTQLKYGEKVSVLSRQGAWYKIAAPADSSVWIAKSYVKDSTVTRSVNLRSGPGINYSSYGILKEGSKVTVLKGNSPDWLKIAPTDGLCAWASSEFIQLQAPAATAARATASPPAPGTKAQTSAKPEITLPYEPGSETKFAAKGIVRPLSQDAVYVTHALIRDDGSKQGIAFLHSDKYSLQLWLERKIELEGKSRRVEGWKLPVVEVEKITPCW